MPSRRSACGGDGDTAAASPGALIYEVPLAVLIRDAALPVLGGGYSGYVTSVFITSQEQACSPHYAMLPRSPLENGRRSIPESTDLFSSSRIRDAVPKHEYVETLQVSLDEDERFARGRGAHLRRHRIARQVGGQIGSGPSLRPVWRSSQQAGAPIASAPARSAMGHASLSTWWKVCTHSSPCTRCMRTRRWLPVAREAILAGAAWSVSTWHSPLSG